MYDFVSLHNHSDYSMLDGLSNIDEYLSRAKELGYKAFGLTDHGYGFGLYELLKKAKASEITAVPGVEFYVAPINPEGAKCKKPVYYGNANGGSKYDVSSRGAYLHLTVWAYNESGLHNLFRLLSLADLPEHYYNKPRIDFNMLAEHSEGLVVSTGCPSSEINTRFLLGQDDKAYEYASRLKDVFGKERLFVEVMDHNMPTDLERSVLPKLVEMSKRLDLGLLATNDSHYARAEDAVAHETFLCIQSKAKMSDKTYDEGGRRFAFSGPEYYLRSKEEMNKLFPDEDYPGAVKNTLLIAEMAQDVSIQYDSSLRPVPKIDTDLPMNEYYMREVLKGLRRRYGDPNKLPRDLRLEINRRVKEEYEVIHSSDFIGYMLTVQEYLKYAQDNFSVLDENGTPIAYPTGIGRGSVGGSIHAYALGISEVDPIRYNLLFSRFLSPGRGAIAEVTYDDGTSEQVIVSQTKLVEDEHGNTVRKYVHEIAEGDTIVEPEENAVSNENC